MTDARDQEPLPPPEELPEVMASPLVPSLRSDLANLERFYVSQGFLGADVEMDDISLSADSTRVEILIGVYEGERRTYRTRVSSDGVVEIRALLHSAGRKGRRLPRPPVEGAPLRLQTRAIARGPALPADRVSWLDPGDRPCRARKGVVRGERVDVGGGRSVEVR